MLGHVCVISVSLEVKKKRKSAKQSYHVINVISAVTSVYSRCHQILIPNY